MQSVESCVCAYVKISEFVFSSHPPRFEVACRASFYIHGSSQDVTLPIPNPGTNLSPKPHTLLESAVLPCYWYVARRRWKCVTARGSHSIALKPSKTYIKIVVLLKRYTRKGICLSQVYLLWIPSWSPYLQEKKMYLLPHNCCGFLRLSTEQRGVQ